METRGTISSYERERGKPPPSKAHGYTQANLTAALVPYCDKYTIFSELTLEFDDRELTPDLSIYPKIDVDLVHDKERVREPPILAVEIATLSQGLENQIERIEVLLQAGIQSCWLVQPPIRTVTLFSGSLDGTTVSSGTFTDPVLNIDVSLNAIFDPDA